MTSMELPRVVVAGDSTAAPYLATAYPMSGWAAHLGAPLTACCHARTSDRSAGASSAIAPIHVVDLAKNGASTSSYIIEGLWTAVLDATSPRDVVVLQFGHNDQKHPDLDPWGGFTRTLTDMVTDVRATGAQPVLATPVARRHFADGTLQRTHGEYPAAVLALAATLEVPCLDLDARTRALLQEQGEDPSRRFFTQLPRGGSPLYPEGIEDNTHFSLTGAICIAEIVAELLAPIVHHTMGAGHGDASEGRHRDASGGAYTDSGGTLHAPNCQGRPLGC